MTTARYIVADVFDGLAALEAEGTQVDLVMTSPPFLALRSYLPPDHPDKAKEIGSEPTPAEFLDTMLAVVEACGKVLAPHGSICFELGDTYAGSGGAGGDYAEGGLREGQAAFDGSAKRAHGTDPMRKHSDDLFHQKSNGRWRTTDKGTGGKAGWPMDKSLTFMPQLFGASLAYGRNLLNPEHAVEPWRVRNFVAWVRPNPPVGALGDKVRPATSYLTWATRARDRWFDLDAVRAPVSEWTQRYADRYPVSERAAAQKHDEHGSMGSMTAAHTDGKGIKQQGAPPLDWWKISPGGYTGSHYACVDDQTEALTAEGWKRQHELRDGDLIAAYDRDSDSWTWQPATFHRYRFDGHLVTIDKRTANQALTPNHRVLYRTAKTETPQVRRADELTTGCFVPMSARMRDQGTDGPGEKLAALAGWTLTEGSVRNGIVTIYQSFTANPTHTATIEHLLSSVGADYYRRDRRGCAEFVIRGELGQWLAGFHKYLPWEAIAAWPDADAQALFDAIIDGDGHRRPNGRCSLIQKSRQVVDAFQALATRLGYRTSIGRHIVSDCWMVYCSPGRWVDLRAGTGGDRPAIGSQEYHGTVWCPSVSTGFWIARRGDIPFVTGNTYPAELCRIPIEASCPRRVCRECGTPSRREVDVAPSEMTGNRSGGVHQGNGGGTAVVGSTKFATEHTTTGWTTCGCPGTDGIRLDGYHTGTGWRPGIVLDPFGGSGTTALAATGLSRDAICIDLDERNADLARDRLGMFVTIETPERAA